MGSLFFTTSDTNPSTFIGGSWERYAKGRTLIGVDEQDDDFTAGKTGGEKSVTLTVDQMPRHNHRTLPYMLNNNGNSAANHVGGYGTLHISQKFSTDDAGGGKPHQNLPPYITIYIWRRTA